MTWYNIWTYPAEIYDNLLQWYIVKKACKEKQSIEEFKKCKYPLRIDKIGRIYTVINLPNEYVEQYKNLHKDVINNYVLTELVNIDEVMLKCNLSEFLYPKIEQISAFSYLIILTPTTDFLSIWKFLRWCLNLGFIYFVYVVLNYFIFKFTDNTIFGNLIDLFKMI